jgi:metal-responsive CopG/Arc/MetJ family transcriptional regulator
MPSIRGKPKEQISYKCPHDLFLKINTAIENGEFASRNDIITAALRTFFENRNYDVKHQITEWLNSDEGEEYLKNVIRVVLEENK